MVLHDQINPHPLHGLAFQWWRCGWGVSWAFINEWGFVVALEGGEALGRLRQLRRYDGAVRWYVTTGTLGLDELAELRQGFARAARRSAWAP